MSKEDYEKFVLKIEKLNKLVELINNSPEKYQLIISCSNHNEVVDLANHWGFEIDKRWGEY
tara:strand:+ start:737 stop:919 length:183 start_codon:yes stop_codon:yes gene_type:complete